MFTVYIAKAAANFGLPATRSIYQRAIEVLPDRQTADMCLRFAALERKLGEIDRARAIYAHASQFCDPRTYTDFWSEWNAFESEYGNVSGVIARWFIVIRAFLLQSTTVRKTRSERCSESSVPSKPHSTPSQYTCTCVCNHPEI